MTAPDNDARAAIARANKIEYADVTDEMVAEYLGKTSFNSPDYLRALADIADPNRLWRRSALESMTREERIQMDTGVALRRHAARVYELNALIGTGKSLLITQLSPNSSAAMTVPTPQQHLRLSTRGELRETLEAARNGLQWYRDAYPDADSGADDEMMARIARVLGEEL